jgi:hypothetical protein
LFADLANDTDKPIEQSKPAANTTLLTLFCLNFDFSVRNMVIEKSITPPAVPAACYHVET